MCCQSTLVAPDELLYFADVCAGPGGFSEYVLWRRHQQLAASISRLTSPSSSKPEPKPEPKTETKTEPKPETKTEMKTEPNVYAVV